MLLWVVAVECMFFTSFVMLCKSAYVLGCPYVIWLYGCWYVCRWYVDILCVIWSVFGCRLFVHACVVSCSTQVLESHANNALAFKCSGVNTSMCFPFYQSYPFLLTFTHYSFFLYPPSTAFLCAQYLCTDTEENIIKKSRNSIPLYNVQKMLTIRINNNLWAYWTKATVSVIDFFSFDTKIS